eukprot:TRINITY_DN8062_c0_g5_i1.p2 TRINITY_DN8062_c0_g5~~TRINITY_DN8062_c0_g5_i1.p2  ORF type:complete len:204 (+),score=59.74 TRINITY_DN8062_c0_g5_i1:69-680(+)
MAAAEGEEVAGAVPSTGADDKSKVKESIEAKGSNSYYYAHAKPKEDLSAAKRIEGDGTRQLADIDGGPAKLEKPDEWLAQVADEEEKKVEQIHWREDYAWGDDGAKVKVYVEFPPGSLKKPEVRVSSRFDRKQFELTVTGLEGGPQGVRNGVHELSHPILPEKCSHRVSAEKGRITVTLVKENPEESWASLKKKVISQHTGWN